MPFKSKSQARACHAKKDPKWNCQEFAHAKKERGSRAHKVQLMTPMNRARKNSAFFVT